MTQPRGRVNQVTGVGLVRPPSADDGGQAFRGTWRRSALFEPGFHAGQ
jgi:hypothetical protein